MELFTRVRCHLFGVAVVKPLVLLTRQQYATLVFAVIVCLFVYLSVHLYVTIWYCVETTGQTKLVWHGGCLPRIQHSVISVIRKFRYLQN